MPVGNTAWYRAGLRALGPTAPPQHRDDRRQLTPSVFEELQPDAYVFIGRQAEHWGIQGFVQNRAGRDCTGRSEFGLEIGGTYHE